MNSADSSFLPVALIALIMGVVSSIFVFLRYSTLRAGSAFLAWIATMAVVLAVPGVRLLRRQSNHFSSSNDHVIISSAFLALLILFGTVFCIRLYRKWLDGQATENERASGAIGIRAWLSPANLAVSGVITLAAWQALDWSPFLTVALCLGLLLLWPALHGQAAAPVASVPPASPAPGTATEREKVLALLEAGKITADESAELLHALNASSASAAAPAPWSPAHKLALAGAILVLVGFFLPWFSFSPGAKLNRAMSEMGFPNEALEAMPNIQATVTARGGDIGHGLGWLVLLLGIAGPLLPHLVTRMDPSALRTVRWLVLGGGGFVVLYLLSQDPRAVSLGLVTVLAGYACETVALWQESRPAVAPAGAPGLRA
jgi:hypothetical protein